MALVDNIKAYWKLEEASGIRYDETDNSYDLTDNNTVTSTTGKIGDGALFAEATSEYLSNATSLGMSMATNFTYNFWVKITALPGVGEVNTPLHWGDDTTTNEKGNVQIQLYNNSGTQEIYLLRQDSAGNDQVGGAYTLTAGTWFMLTYTWDGSNHKLYINGSGTPTLTQASTRTGTNTATGSYGTKIEIGGDSTNSRYIDGELDEFGVWSRVLTAEEITALYNSGDGFQYPFVINYEMAVTVGEFALTGIDIALNYGKTLIAEAGSFTLTGVDALFYRATIMSVTVGEFVLTGIDALFSKGKTLVANTGSFILTGSDTAFKIARKMTVTVGEFTLTGINVALSRGYNLIAGTGSFILTWKDILINKEVATIWTNLTKNEEGTISNLSKTISTWINKDKN